MVEAEKAKIRAEYERKEKQIEVQKRISQSNEVRLGRLRCLKARDDAMQAILAETAAKLPSLTAGSGYASLLEKLILEALIRIDEAKVSVRGVAGQAPAAQKACTAAAAKYKARRHVRDPSEPPPPSNVSARPSTTRCGRKKERAPSSCRSDGEWKRGWEDGARRGRTACGYFTTPPLPSFRQDWAAKNKDAAFASSIEVVWDSSPLAAGIGGVEAPGSRRSDVYPSLRWRHNICCTPPPLL